MRSVEVVQPDLPPAVYQFWSDTDRRCLYVGQASRNVGDRIKAHFDGRRSHALEGTVIRYQFLRHGATQLELDLAEQTLIHQLTPRGNKQHNWSHYDRVWDMRVQRRHYQAAKARVPWALTWALAKVWVRDTVKRAARGLLLVATVDVLLALVWYLMR